jgi:hypothetical protein
VQRLVYRLADLIILAVDFGGFVAFYLGGLIAFDLLGFVNGLVRIVGLAGEYAGG